MVILHQKLLVLYNNHQRCIVALGLFFFGYRSVHSSSAPAVELNESLSKSICLQTTQFSKTREVQPALNNKNKFQQFVGCQSVRWTKCVSNCKKFERRTAAKDCSSTERPKDGKKENQARIIGGTEAEPHEFPYQAHFVSPFGVSFCGGIIYNAWYIITAAHCFPFKQLERDTIVVVGDHDKSKENIYKKRFEADKLIMHEKFIQTENQMEYDLALVKLAEEIKFNNGVQPILMPKPNSKPCGRGIVTGWGEQNKTHPGGFTDILHKVILPVVPFAKCAAAYKTINTTMLENTFCAGYFGEVEKDACSGDSGGPIAKKLKNGSYVLMGVVSYFSGICADPKLPFVFTEIAQFLDWIQSKIV